MKTVLRICLRGLIAVIVLVIALFCYFVYSPFPEIPRLSGKLTEGTVQVGALNRTYMTYVPKGLAKGAPLVVVLHGSDQNGAQIRPWTGYGSTAWPMNMDLELRIPMDTRVIGMRAISSETIARTS
jgi:polyhydroxybutyrate depolymerase